MFEVSEEFFPLCFTRLLRKLVDFDACFKVLGVIVGYHPTANVNGPTLMLLKARESDEVDPFNGAT